MNEPEEPPRHHRWPYIAIAFVVIFIISAVIFMTVAVKKLERERDFNSPLPGTAPLR
jgi:hypothetical protein